MSQEYNLIDCGQQISWKKCLLYIRDAVNVWSGCLEKWTTPLHSNACAWNQDKHKHACNTGRLVSNWMNLKFKHEEHIAAASQFPFIQCKMLSSGDGRSRGSLGVLIASFSGWGWDYWSQNAWWKIDAICIISTWETALRGPYPGPEWWKIAAISYHDSWTGTIVPSHTKKRCYLDPRSTSCCLSHSQKSALSFQKKETGRGQYP